MNSIERVVMKWLEARDDGWSWFFGGTKYDKKATLERFKKDKQFRNLIITQVEKVAIEMFEKSLKKTEE
jgi:hypothetical protein